MNSQTPSHTNTSLIKTAAGDFLKGTRTTSQDTAPTLHRHPNKENQHPSYNESDNNIMPLTNKNIVFNTTFQSDQFKPILAIHETVPAPLASADYQLT